MRISSISLENFQSHKKTHIKLSSGVNVFSGVSRAGKSAILRCLNWVFNNSPAGDIFNSYWGGDTIGEVLFECGTKVARIRGKSVNKYVLQLSGEEPKVFTGFNQGVPEAIKKALNIHDFNMRFQHQGAFLLSNNSGEISKYLNKVAKLDSIDVSISNISSVLKLENQNKEREDAEIDRLMKSLVNFEWLDKAGEDLKRLENDDENINIDTKKYNLLFDIIDEVSSLNAKKEPIRNLLLAKKELTSIDSLLDNFEFDTDKRRNIYSIIESIKSLQIKINVPKKLIAETQKVKNLLTEDKEILRISEKVNSLNACIDEIKLLKSKKRSASLISSKSKKVLSLVSDQEKLNKDFLRRKLLSEIIDTVKSIRKQSSECRSKLLKAKRIFDSEMPDICPLCGK